MKKFMVSLVCVLAYGSVSAFTTQSMRLELSQKAEQVVLTKLSSSSDWEHYTTIRSITRLGNKFSTTKKGQFSVRKNNKGNYQIQFNGAYYNVSTSDISGYTHKFCADGYWWYFNM